MGFDKVYRFIHSVLCRVHNVAYEAKSKKPSDAPRALIGFFVVGRIEITLSLLFEQGAAKRSKNGV